MLRNIIPVQPLSGTTIGNYWQLLKHNHFNIAPKYLPRVLYTLLLATLATTPLVQIEKRRKQKIIEQTAIEHPPLFIIGHWRSGTTFLHYLLSKDKNFGFINNVQSFSPGYMFHHFPNIIKKIIGLHIPEKRPMDAVQLSLDSPQEEEFALGNMGLQSCYHWWTFPEKMQHYFDKYALLKHFSDTEYRQFQKTYLNLMKKVNLLYPDKRLLIKNPVNTGRIPFLLELFPNAQFIYLHRNPHEVHLSTVKLHSKLLNCFSFQTIVPEQIEKNTRQFYRQLLEKYETDKQYIPKGNLIEVDYHKMVQEPLNAVKEIYTHLSIPDFHNTHPAFQNFIRTQKDYKADAYPKQSVRETSIS